MRKLTKKQVQEQKKIRGAEAREALRKFLVKYTDCDIQHTGYPCGTCFMALLDRLGLDATKPEYKEHNTPRDRHNEVWRAILQIREAE